MKEITMPKLELTMDKGILNLWYKKEGEFVKKGEPLFEVEADKTNFVVDSDYNGIFIKTLVNTGEEIQVGQVIGYIEEKKE
jgi:pyruvate dehydrogenase E2 component (dihydrolipoamide acetyltransferase)